jgi:hypothetical protein
MTTIHLTISDRNLIKTVIDREIGGCNYSWVYLGMDVTFDMELRTLTGKMGQRISIADEIQQNAHQYREEYIQVIGELKPGDDLLSWWLSNTAEKNPFVFNPFLAFCYIRACQNLTADCPQDIIVICQSRGLLLSLKKGLASCRLHLKTHDTPLVKACDSLRLYFGGFLHLGWFAVSYSYRSVLSHLVEIFRTKNSFLKNSPHNWICIHSWVDKRSFKNPDTYTDVYFGSLGNDLTRKGYKVVYLVDILPTYSYFRALWNLKKKTETFIIFEDFITPLDILSAYVRVKVPDSPKDKAFIGGVDVSDVLEEGMTRELLDPRRRWSFLCYCVSKKIGRDCPPERFIFTFENHMWEKMFCLGFHESRKKIQLVGYAHTIVNKFYTSYSVSNKETDSSSLPDRIIVNGTAAAKVLAGSGFDPDHIIIGGSLRYSHLWSSQNTARTKRTDTIIVVAASADIHESLELLHCAQKVFGEKKQITVVVKCHPTVPYSQIAPFLPELPKNFTICEESIASVLQDADLLLFTSSASAVEAFALGIPVIHVKSEYRIDMNIFDDVALVPSLSSDQLAKIPSIQREIARLKESLKDTQTREQIVLSLLSRPDERSIDLFVSDINA